MEPRVRPAPHAPTGFGPWDFFCLGVALERVNAFIDGYNLYHAIDNLRQPHLKWLDLRALCECFISRKTQRLEEVFYFSAPTWKFESSRRQKAFWAALDTRNVTRIMGRFQKREQECKCCGSQWTAHEEKQSDVNLGVTMVARGIDNRYDCAMLISEDSDFVFAVRAVVELGKKVQLVVPPHRRYSGQLSQAAQGNKAKIKLTHLEQCQLDDVVEDDSGNEVAKRPAAYKRPAS